MTGRDKLRVGAVSYLNTRPLVHGLEHGLAADRIELSYAVPARLADEMRAGRLDVALLPVVELASIPGLEIVPGLAIVSRGVTRSVLLLAKKPLEQVSRVSLGPHSRTSNALTRVLFAEAWGGTPEFVTGPVALDAALAGADAAVRIGDKALFESVPAGLEVHDLGEVWTERTGLPFVFAVWAARPGMVDRQLYRDLHASRRAGSAAIREIAQDYRWNGAPGGELAETYLREHIHFRFGSAELEGLRRFLDACQRAQIIPRVPELRLAMRRRTTCDERAEQLGLT